MTTSKRDAYEGNAAMKGEKLEVVRGSGNAFRDLGHKSADAEQFKAILAAEIIKALEREQLTVRAAHARTGIAAADFSRIRNADLGRFTVDRLISVLNRLGSRGGEGEGASRRSHGPRVETRSVGRDMGRPLVDARKDPTPPKEGGMGHPLGQVHS